MQDSLKHFCAGPMQEGQPWKTGEIIWGYVHRSFRSKDQIVWLFLLEEKFKEVLQERGDWSEDCNTLLRDIRKDETRPQYLHKTPNFSMNTAEGIKRKQPRVFRMDISLLPIDGQMKEALFQLRSDQS